MHGTKTMIACIYICYGKKNFNMLQIFVDFIENHFQEMKGLFYKGLKSIYYMSKMDIIAVGNKPFKHESSWNSRY